MRELDTLLTGYLDAGYDAATDEEKSAFHAILRLPDPELVRYLLQKQVPDSEPVARVIEHILGRTPS